MECEQYQPIDCNRREDAGRREAWEPLWLGRIRDVMARCDRRRTEDGAGQVVIYGYALR